MSAVYQVQYAVWGGQPNSAPQYTASNITVQLQNLLNNGTLQVTFDGVQIPDPLIGTDKGWAVIISINGKVYYYAGIDYQTVDFTVLPHNS